MSSSTRLTLILVAFAMFPVVLIGGIVLVAAWSPDLNLWSLMQQHWMACGLIGLVAAGSIATAVGVARRVTEQLALVTKTAAAINRGTRKYIARMPPQHFYPELQPLYESLINHITFHEEFTRTLAEIVRNADSTKTLAPRTEDDEFIRLLNSLIARLQKISQIITVVAEGHLAVLKPLDDNEMDLEHQIYNMITELSDLISQARHYTNQIVRTDSQINSITLQGLQDTKVATRQINEVSQSIHQMATNIQKVAEHLQQQSGVLGDTSASIEHTMHSIEEIAGNITHLKTIIEQTPPSSQASEQTASSLDLLYQTTQAIERDANTCVLRSQEAAEDAEHGTVAVQQMITGIHRIRETMTEFFEIVRHLGDRATEVNETLDVISDIADHTNLLAINASIISAHAGEHGRDFAVIADEIGKFAERTRESTHEIEDLLNAIQTEFGEAIRAMNKTSKAVSQGVELSQKAGQSLEKILSGIVTTKDLVTRIATATTDQSRENEHIRQIMEELVHSQMQKQEQVNTILWQLMQTFAQIRGITTEQAEGNARMAAMAHNLDQITQEIGQATDQSKQSADQIVTAVQSIRKLVQRTTLGTEKTAQLTQELFSLGGNLALAMGEFVLTNRTVQADLDSQTPLIGFIRRGSDSFFDYMAAGIRQEAEPYGFAVIETNSGYEATLQVEDLNWLLKQPGLQGIILCPVDTSVSQKLVQKANERGIPCVAADESVVNTLAVRSGNRESGRRAAEIFLDHLPSDALIGIMVDRAVESMVRRAEGFRQQASEQTAFDIIEIYCDLVDDAQLHRYLIAGIEDNPGLNGLFLPNEKITTAYLELLEHDQLPASDALVVGYDYTPMAKEAIRNGDLLGAIFQNPEEIGQQAFQYLRKLIRKELRLEDLTERTIYIPTVKVTQESLSTPDMQRTEPLEGLPA
jgi:methyl-accepting chemotaxis protein/ABC-type sugar transport system substrate-binding protein